MLWQNVLLEIWFLLLTFLLCEFLSRRRRPGYDDWWIKTNNKSWRKKIISKSNSKCLAPFSIAIKILKSSGTLNMRSIAIDLLHFFEKNIFLKHVIVTGYVHVSLIPHYTNIEHNIVMKACWFMYNVLCENVYF